MTNNELDKLEAALRIVTNAMAEKYPLGTDFGRYESYIRTIIEGAQKWVEHLAAQRQSNNNWLEAQLEEAKKDYENWPEWKKECSRTGEFLRNKEQRQGGDAEWFIDGTLVYSLKHGGWKKGAEIKTNATTISVDGDNAESIAGIIHAALNNHLPAVTGDRRAALDWINLGTQFIEEDYDDSFDKELDDHVLAIHETIRAALLSAQAGVPGDLVAAMTHVIAIAKAYKADESAGRNYKGANESNRKAIERAEMLLYPYLNTDGRE